jgi:hypothetical protein
MSKEIEIPMKKVKDCKSSVRFGTDDEKAPIRDVYISRATDGVNNAPTVTLKLVIGTN